MAGIFDRLNHPGTGENDKTLPSSTICGALLFKVSGLRTNQQIIDSLNAALSPGPALDADALDDLADVFAYIDAGTGESGKAARLTRFCYAAGIWETGQLGVTEAEARSMTGVPFD